jgi:hypothetical protein
MRPGLVTKTGDAVEYLLGALKPFLPLVDGPEAEALLADVDRLLAMAADGAGVVVVTNQIAGMARRLREAAAVAFDQDAEAQLARIEGSAMRLRDSWAVHVNARRRAR